MWVMTRAFGPPKNLAPFRGLIPGEVGLKAVRGGASPLKRAAWRNIAAPISPAQRAGATPAFGGQRTVNGPEMAASCRVPEFRRGIPYGAPRACRVPKVQ
jgi:hypothetical protein